MIKESSDLVTRAVLKEELKKLATRIELKKVEKSFASKIEDTELALMVRIEERAEKTERVLREEIKKSEGNLMTKMDGIAKGLQDMREDNAAGELRLRDHEKRISNLESAA